jgi:hypothetical protein
MAPHAKKVLPPAAILAKSWMSRVRDGSPCITVDLCEKKFDIEAKERREIFLNALPYQ